MIYTCRVTEGEELKTGFVSEISTNGQDGITYGNRKARGSKGLSPGLEIKMFLLNIFGLK